MYIISTNFIEGLLQTALDFRLSCAAENKKDVFLLMIGENLATVIIDIEG